MGSGGGGGGNPAALSQQSAPMAGLPIAGGAGGDIDPFDYGFFQNFLPNIPAEGKGPAPSATGLTAEMFKYLSPSGNSPDAMKNQLAAAVAGGTQGGGLRDQLIWGQGAAPQTMGANGSPAGPETPAFGNAKTYGEWLDKGGLAGMKASPNTPFPPASAAGEFLPGSTTMTAAGGGGPPKSTLPGWATMIGNPGSGNPWAGSPGNTTPGYATNYMNYMPMGSVTGGY